MSTATETEYFEDIGSAMWETIDRMLLFTVLTILAFVQMWLVSERIEASSELAQTLEFAYAFVGPALLLYMASPLLAVFWRNRGHWIGKAALALAGTAVAYEILSKAVSVL